MKKRISGFLVKALAIALVFIMGSLNAAPVSVQAATKKTVRVATEKALKKALKNSKIGTIILRTETVDPITINSTKSKKKKLIVDAPSAVVTNNAVFKSIEVEKVQKYIENVSGNTVTLNNDVSFEITAGNSMKKIVFTNISPWSEMRYVIRNGASIKKIALIEDDGRVHDDGDRTFIIEKSIQYGDYDDADITDYRIDLKFDEDGRLIGKQTKNLSETGEDFSDNYIYDYSYDENRNLSKLVISNTDYDYDLTEINYYYDGNNNLIEYNENYDDRPVCGYAYEYDSAGRMTECNYVEEAKSRSFTYSYDKKGRLVEETGKYYDFIFTEDGIQEEETRSYIAKTTYSKNGCELKITYDWGGDADAVKSVVTYEYDKDGNRISYRSEDYYDKNDPENVNIYRNEYEYDKYGNLLNAYYIDDDGRRVNMDDIAG